VQHRAVAVDGRPVAARDRAGELEPVRDRALHQGDERFGRSTCALDEVGGDAVERDEEVRRDRSARVVERALVVGEDERAQAEGLREPEPACACVL
jgi:hypothetical protein